MKHHCGKALANADRGILATLFDRLINTDTGVWEFGFDTYSMTTCRNSQTDQLRAKNWQEAFSLVAGDDAVLTGEASVDQLGRKGYKPIKAPENLVRAAEQYGVQTPGRVLSADELSGREISDATPDAQAAVDLVWEWLEETGLTNGKDKPPVKVFTSILNGGTMLNGYYRSGEVFINADLAGAGFVAGGRQSLSHRLLVVALEEVAHFVTEATDNSRDFQNYLLDVAVKLAAGRVKHTVVAV